MTTTATNSATALPKTNAKTAYGLLNAIARIALEEPQRLAMGFVCHRGAGLKAKAEERPGTKIPPCGTAGCIAGWTLVLTGQTKEDERNGGSYYDATDVLGLTDYQAEQLFYLSELVHAANQQTPEHAQAVVAHIREFQAANRDQLKATKVKIPPPFRAPAPKGGR